MTQRGMQAIRPAPYHFVIRVIRFDGHPQDRIGKLCERISIWCHIDDKPARRIFPQHGDQAGTDHTTLATAACPYHSQKTCAFNRPQQVQIEVLDQLFAPEEVFSIRFLKSQQPFIRVRRFGFYRFRFGCGFDGQRFGRSRYRWNKYHLMKFPCHLKHISIAIPWVFAGGTLDNPINLRGDIRSLRSQRRDFFIKLFTQQGFIIHSIKGFFACQDLIQHDAKAVNIGARINRHTQNLFRGHIFRGAVDRRLCTAGTFLTASKNTFFIDRIIELIEFLGDTKITQIGISLLIKQDIGRLDVLMDDIIAVGCRQRLCNLIEHERSLFQ